MPVGVNSKKNVDKPAELGELGAAEDEFLPGSKGGTGDVRRSVRSWTPPRSLRFVTRQVQLFISDRSEVFLPTDYYCQAFMFGRDGGFMFDPWISSVHHDFSLCSSQRLQVCDCFLQLSYNWCISSPKTWTGREEPATFEIRSFLGNWPRSGTWTQQAKRPFVQYFPDHPWHWNRYIHIVLHLYPFMTLI